MAADRDSANLYLIAVSEAELLYGVAIMPTGRRPNALEAAMGRYGLGRLKGGKAILPRHSGRMRKCLNARRWCNRKQTWQPSYRLLLLRSALVRSPLWWLIPMPCGRCRL